MKTIIQENHYQKRLWEDACFERDLKSGKFDDLLRDEAEFERRRATSLEETKRKFKIASRYAVSLARHYEMNVHVKASDSLGIIELACDEIMFDTLWNDGNWRRCFVCLFLFASGVCVQSRSENGNAY